MAIYHCSVKCITRSEGRSAVAAAAYRSGEKLTNCYDGVTHDYTQKRWIIHQGIMLPKQAPEHYKDRSTLWNAVEMAERSSTCRLAREVQVALPVELSMEENLALVKQYIQENFVSKGMCADFAIHSPPKTNDRHQPVDQAGRPTKRLNEMQFNNPHTHILLTIRPLDEKGKWQAKSQIEYVCMRDGEEKSMTAAEFKQAKADGWEKQYRFLENGKKVWLPATAGKEQGLERISKMPKTTRFGRENPICQQWNSEASILQWRKSWEDIVNLKFEEKQLSVRIDSRSFKDQGRKEEIPTIHLGPEATHMNRRAERMIAEGELADHVIRPEKWIVNEKIKAHNRLVKKLREKLAQAVERMKRQTKAYIGKLAHQLESLRNRIVDAVYESAVFENQYSVDKMKWQTDKEKFDYLEALMTDAERQRKLSEAHIQLIREKMNQLSFIEFTKKRSYMKELEAEQQKVQALHTYVESEFKKYGVDSVDFYKGKENSEADRIRIQEQYQETLKHVEEAEYTYGQVFQDVPDEVIEAVQEERQRIRQANEQEAMKRLKNKSNGAFDTYLYKKALQKVDQNLHQAGLDVKTDYDTYQTSKVKQHDTSTNRRR